MVVPNDARSPGGSPFGRIPSLTAQIRELIHDYPEGIGIIKELAQNADDAGARALEIVIDRRDHARARLPNPAMAVLQGPALLCYNDSVFTEDDFNRIQEIYRSGKVRAADKTGQFGKGFNTVYNVTDWPSFVTGERVAFFDPHCSIVPGADRVNPGRCWKLAECWSQYPDLLRPFGAAGLEAGATRFEGTIFRLPLRTAEQAAHSEISRKPFGEGNIRGLIDELAEVRDSLLLFLKRLEAVRLREVLASGTVRQRVVIETANVEDVRQKRRELLDILEGDALAVVQRLRGRAPVLISYQHNFRSSWLRRERGEPVNEDSAWRVLHCLGLDREGKIAEAVEYMLGTDVKAVPLGGAAVRLAPAEEEDAPPRGKVYCSLPLPIDTGLPVHLNGFFDLDSSRHSLTTEAGLTGGAKVRARWNQLLVEHVVAPAYAHLIDRLGEDLGGDEAQRYYASWPDAGQPLPKPLDTLVKVVYQNLAPLRVIRVQGDEEWAAIGKVVLLPAGWDDLEEPLAADGLPLAEPRLSAVVVAGFEKAGVAVQKVSPQSVRDWLRQQARIVQPGVAVAQAPRACLRQRPWLEVFLRFCLSDRPKDLTDLPLALMADGRLRSFVVDPRFPIFAAGPDERSLFAGQPAWFLDRGFAEACGLAAPPVPGGLSWMTPGEVTRCLPALLPDGGEIRLRPDGPAAAFPTVGWLTSLYRYLLKSVRGGQRWTLDDFRKVPLVPDQAGILRCPALLSSPLLGREQEMQDLGVPLRALSVPLVSAPPDLRDAIAAFAGAFTGFIWKLTGPDLVDTLATLEADCFPAYRQEVHHPLLDFLAHPQSTAEAYRALPDRISDLRQLAIFPTADGRVIDLQADVRIPGDFAPPSCVRSVKLLQTGPANAWLRLLVLGGVPRLTRAGFIEEYLLPEYAAMGPENKLAALRWLRDNLGRAQSELEEEGESPGPLGGAVREAELIQCEDGECRCALAVYDPESDLIRDLFGDAVPYPDRAHYAKGWDRWAAFFVALGLIRKPHAQDLLRHIDRLCQEATNGLTVRLTARVLKVFDHVEEHWAELSREPIEDPHGEDLASALQERAWLPAETSARGLRRWPGAVAPEGRLYRPDELHLPAQANLASSQCPVFARARAKVDVQRALGFLTDVPLETVLLHFRHLLKLWEGSGRPAREPFEAALQDIYRYLGRYAKGPEAPAIRGQFAGVACLWYRGRLWLPEHAFRSKVPFFGNRRVTIHVRDATRTAYHLLGVRERPSLADFLSYVEEIVDEFGNKSLPGDEIERLLDIYRRIGEEAGGDGSLEERFPLLTERGILVDPQDAFYADAPWFQERINDPRVQFLHRSLPVTVTQLPWVRSLAREVSERPTGLTAPHESPEVKRRAAELETLIRTPEFRCGVARLVYHEHGTYRSSIAGWLARTGIVAVKELTSELVLALDDEDIVVGSGPSDQYLDSQGPYIYVAGNAGRLIRTFVAQAINSGLDECRLRDQAPLADILDCEPAEIDQTLTRLRIKPVDDEGAFARPEADVEDGSPADPDDQDIGPVADDEDRGLASREEAHPTDDVGGARADNSGAGDSKDAIPPPPQPRPRAAPAAAPGAGGPAPRREGADAPGSSDGRRPGRDGRPGGTGTATAGGPRVPRPVEEDEPAPEGRRTGPSLLPVEPGQGRSDARTPRGRSSEAAPRANGGPAEPKQPGSPRDVRMRRRKARGRREQERQKDRIVTYVSFGPAGEATEAAPLSDEERLARMKLGDAAADIACAFERTHDRTPTKLAHNHPGWDIDSLDVSRVESEGAAGTPSRMIEVKGVRGPWTRQGVSVSRRQFETAQQFGDRYWLYVVEFADDPARARVHPIHNPFSKIKQFWFDSGWRQLADPVEAPSAGCVLTVGQRISLETVGVGSVERVEGRGALRIVHVRLDGGTLVRKPFNPSTMRPL